MRAYSAGAFTVLLMLWWGLAQSAPEKVDQAKVGPACNFQASYMTWDLPPHKDPRPNARHNIPKANKARIQLDATINVINEETGANERFVLIAHCRTES